MNTLTTPSHGTVPAPKSALSDESPVALRVFKAAILCPAAVFVTVLVAIEVWRHGPSASDPQRNFLLGGAALLIFLPWLAWSLAFNQASRPVAVGLRLAVVLVFLAGILDRVSGLGALPVGTAEVAACSLALLWLLNDSQKPCVRTDAVKPA